MSVSRRWVWAIVLCVSLGGTALRIAAVRTAVARGDHVTGDSYSYLVVAYSIREIFSPPPKPSPKWLRNGIFSRDPIYPAALALVGDGNRVCADDVLTGRKPFRCGLSHALGLNVVFGFLACVLTFLLGARLGGTAIGLIACVLVASSPNLINSGATVMTEPFRVPFNLGLLLLLDVFRRRPTVAMALATGAFTALVALIHTSTTFLPLFIGVWVWFFVRPRARWIFASFWLPLLVTAVIWIVTSKAQFGRPMMPGAGGMGFSGGGAWTAMVASRPDNDGAVTEFDFDYVSIPLTPRLLKRLDSDGRDPALPPLEPEIAEWIRANGIGAAIPDSVFWRVYKNRMRQHPLAFAWLSFKKGWAMMTFTTDDYVLAQGAPIPASHGLLLVLLFLGVAGLFLPKSGLDRPGKWLLFMLPAFVFLLHALVSAHPRYWTTVLPEESILAAAALVAMYRWLKDRADAGQANAAHSQ